MTKSASSEGESDLQRLIEQALAGDQRALAEVLGHCYDYVLPVCAAIVGHSDAEDAAQVALISVAHNLHKFAGRSKLRTWVHRIAVNAAIDEKRRRARRPIAVDPDDHAQLPSTRPDDDPERLPEIELVRAEIARLDEDQREALLLREYRGLSYAEIADHLGVPIGTVRSRIARARASLIEALRITATDPADRDGNYSSTPNVKEAR